MHDALLNPAQQSALALLSPVRESGTFYLAGGTALALHLGHREPVDFGFFRARDTLTVDCGGVKVSFFGCPLDVIQEILYSAVPWDQIKRYFTTETARLHR